MTCWADVLGCVHVQSMNGIPASFPDTGTLDELAERSDYQCKMINMVRASAGKYQSDSFKQLQARMVEVGTGGFLVVFRKPSFGWVSYETALLLRETFIAHLVPAIQHWGANMLKKLFKLILHHAIDMDAAAGNEARQQAIQAICHAAKLPFEFRKEASRQSSKYACTVHTWLWKQHLRFVPVVQVPQDHHELQLWCYLHPAQGLRSPADCCSRLPRRF
jgi:hypothetical protein